MFNLPSQDPDQFFCVKIEFWLDAGMSHNYSMCKNVRQYERL